jgi:transcriptional regulator GlxA family with amidase domain
MSLTKPISFGILAFPYQAIDVAGPVDILSSCSSHLIAGGEAAHAPGYAGLTAKSINITFHHIGIDLSPVLLTANMSIVPTTTVSTCPELDYLLIGGPDTFTYNLPAIFGDFIRAHLAAGKGLFTNCTGAMAIAPFGVLDGKRATVNHGVLEYAMKLFPGVKWEKKQWVEDGKSQHLGV